MGGGGLSWASPWPPESVRDCQQPALRTQKLAKLRCMTPNTTGVPLPLCHQLRPMVRVPDGGRGHKPSACGGWRSTGECVRLVVTGPAHPTVAELKCMTPNAAGTSSPMCAVSHGRWCVFQSGKGARQVRMGGGDQPCTPKRGQVAKHGPKRPRHMSAHMCHELRPMVRIPQGGRRQKSSQKTVGQAHLLWLLLSEHEHCKKKKRTSATAVCLEHTILGRKSVPRAPMSVSETNRRQSIPKARNVSLSTTPVEVCIWIGGWPSASRGPSLARS